MDPFLGQLLLVSFGFPPKGWAFCNGQLLPIAQNQALFSLLGTTYGGDGRVTFGLPDLRGRMPMGAGQGIQLGQKGGEETHTLINSEMPQHIHFFFGTSQNADGSIAPGGAALATTVGSPAPPAYNTAAPNVPMSGGFVSTVGGSQPHDNRQPYLTMNWIIALVGIFPSRT